MWTLLAFLSGQELVLELESFLVDQHLKRSLLPWIYFISNGKSVFQDNCKLFDESPRIFDVWKSSKKVNCGYGIGFAYSCNEALAPSIDTDLWYASLAFA